MHHERGSGESPEPSAPPHSLHTVPPDTGYAQRGQRPARAEASAYRGPRHAERQRNCHPEHRVDQDADPDRTDRKVRRADGERTVAKPALARLFPAVTQRNTGPAVRPVLIDADGLGARRRKGCESGDQTPRRQHARREHCCGASFRAVPSRGPRSNRPRSRLRCNRPARVLGDLRGRPCRMRVHRLPVLGRCHRDHPRDGDVQRGGDEEEGEYWNDSGPQRTCLDEIRCSPTEQSAAE